MQAAKWGFGTALVHRLLLTLWLALVWSVVGANLGGTQADFHTAGALLPSLNTPVEEAVFGVWRRWDAVHYLDLAVNGYRVEHPGPTVFGILTPLGIHAFDIALPGSVDLAAAVFEVLAFGLALTLIYKVGDAYYGDAELGRWALVVTALLPLSYFFEAPMSESIYLAMTLGVFYFGARKHWLAAAVCGALATLARSQGVLLLPVAGLLLLESNGFTLTNRADWLDQMRRATPARLDARAHPARLRRLHPLPPEPRLAPARRDLQPVFLHLPDEPARRYDHQPALDSRAFRRAR